MPESSHTPGADGRSLAVPIALGIVIAVVAVLRWGVPLLGSGGNASAPQGDVSETAGASLSAGEAATESPSVLRRNLFRDLPPPTRYVEGRVFGDIDLNEVQAALPDNLYWSLAAPTKDEDILALREEEKRLRNLEYGAVLSGNADAGDVDAYYDFRERMSRDYLAFADHMLERYRDTAPEQMIGLLELTQKLHAGRLAQLPKERERGHTRRVEQEAARRAWREQQEAFGNAAPSGDG